MIRVRFPVAAATAVLLAACAACGTSANSSASVSGSTPAALASLYEQAVKAGQTTVVFYGPQAADLKNAFAVFEKRFPKITVDAVNLFGPQLDTKVQTEASTGKHSGDLVQVANDPISFAQAGLCQAYKPPTAGQVPTQYSDLNNQVIASTVIPFGILYNKDKISSPPKSWADLVSGKYKNQMVVADPTVGGVSDAMSAGLVSGTFTEDYLRKLKEQGLQTVADGQAAAQAVATGQAGIGIFLPAVVYEQMHAKGVNVGFTFPVQGGTYLSPFLNCLLKGAPHPTAAKLLESWFFTAEGQSAQADLGQYSTVPGAPAPAGLPALSSVQQMKLPSLSETFTQSAAERTSLQSVF